MRSLVKFTGDIEVELLTFEIIRKWKLHLDKSRSPATVRCYIIKLRVVLTYLKNKNIQSIDPELIPVPKRADKVPIFLNKEEVKILINSTKQIKNKAIISLLYASGIRISELCSLDRDSIKNNSFTIIGKGGKARLCFLDERTAVLIDLYLETRVDNQKPLFLTLYGKRITPGTIQETFKSVRKISGIECHPHTLRHSFATNLLSNNTNLFHVSKMLGHAQLNTTQNYLHVIDTDLQQVYNKKHTT